MIEMYRTAQWPCEGNRQQIFSAGLPVLQGSQVPFPFPPQAQPAKRKVQAHYSSSIRRRHLLCSDYSQGP